MAERQPLQILNQNKNQMTRKELLDQWKKSKLSTQKPFGGVSTRTRSQTAADFISDMKENANAISLLPKQLNKNTNKNMTIGRAQGTGQKRKLPATDSNVTQSQSKRGKSSLTPSPVPTTTSTPSLPPTIIPSSIPVASNIPIKIPSPSRTTSHSLFPTETQENINLDGNTSTNSTTTVIIDSNNLQVRRESGLRKKQESFLSDGSEADQHTEENPMQDIWDGEDVDESANPFLSNTASNSVELEQVKNELAKMHLTSENMQMEMRHLTDENAQLREMVQLYQKLQKQEERNGVENTKLLEENYQLGEQIKQLENTLYEGKNQLLVVTRMLNESAEDNENLIAQIHQLKANQQETEQLHNSYQQVSLLYNIAQTTMDSDVEVIQKLKRQLEFSQSMVAALQRQLRKEEEMREKLLKNQQRALMSECKKAMNDSEALRFSNELLLQQMAEMQYKYQQTLKQTQDIAGRRQHEETLKWQSIMDTTIQQLHDEMINGLTTSINRITSLQADLKREQETTSELRQKVNLLESMRNTGEDHENNNNEESSITTRMNNRKESIESISSTAATDGGDHNDADSIDDS